MISTSSTTSDGAGEQDRTETVQFRTALEIYFGCNRCGQQPTSACIGERSVERLCRACRKHFFGVSS